MEISLDGMGGGGCWVVVCGGGAVGGAGKA